MVHLATCLARYKCFLIYNDAHVFINGSPPFQLLLWPQHQITHGKAQLIEC